MANETPSELLRRAAAVIETPGDLDDLEKHQLVEDLLDAAGCEGCDGSGVRPYANMDHPHAGPPPEGFVIVEKCDTCDKYPDDLTAAQAWGTNARWQDGNGTSQAIAKPKPPGPTITQLIPGNPFLVTINDGIAILLAP